ncbi:MAG: HDOD domain-containing protein [Magnetococcales bacterium]|nr:HDOD domain-containing protein [Magnetococcales bacterium]
MAFSESDLLSLMKTMPAFPHSGYRILKIANDINHPPKELVKVIEQDPILTMHLLKLVNSEHFGLAKKITAIKEAVVFLGLNTMKNLALAIAPVELLGGGKEFPKALTSILRHSLTTAIIAKKLARDLGVNENQATDCYVAGLLHDFGKVALFQLIPQRYELLLKRSYIPESSFLDAEMNSISTTHTVVGEHLGRSWQLPELIIRSMGRHHDPESCADSPLLACVYTANLIANRMLQKHSESSNDTYPLPPSLVSLFGRDLESLSVTMGLIADEIDQALLLTTIQEDGSLTESTPHS